MLDPPAVRITGVSQRPLPDHVGGRRNGAGARVDSQLHSTEIRQAEVPPHGGHHQCFDMHHVLGQPRNCRRGLLEVPV